MITIADDGRGLDKAGILRKARENGLLTKAEEDYTEKEIYHMEASEEAALPEPILPISRRTSICISFKLS